MRPILVGWLTGRKVVDDLYNVGSLAGGIFPHGGKWYIPREEMSEFFRLYEEACAQGYILCFVYKPLREDLPSPLHFDIDVKTKNEIPVDVDAFVNLAKEVAKIIAAKRPGPVRFTVVCKPNGYYKKRKKEKDIVYATGSHFYFENTICDPVFAEDIRQVGMRHVPNILGHLNLINSVDDVFDARIPSLRANGLMLLNSFKPKKEGGVYRAVYTGVFQDGEFTKMQKTSTMEELYAPIFAVDRKTLPAPPVIEAPPEIRKTPPREPVRNGEVVVGAPDEFNLGEFCKATEGWVPNNTQYVELCMFLAGIGYDPFAAQRLLNSAWCPPPDKLNETSRIIRQYGDGRPITCTRGTAQFLLTSHASKEYDLRVIFPQKYKFHNESHMFDVADKKWNMNEINEFFTQVYSFCWGGGRTEFIWREQRKKRFGKMYYTTETVVISDNPPFGCAVTDKLILVTPELKELVKELKKLSTQKTQKCNQEDPLGSLNRVLDAKKLLKTYRKLPQDKQYQTLLAFLGEDVPEACERSLGTLFLNCKQRGQIKQQYHSYTVEPFLKVDRTPDDVLNIFQPFELQRFSKPGEADVKSSNVWKWLKTAWAGNDEYKMRWLLCYFASKLQFPWRKVCKFLTCFARLCGCGKTSVRGFTTAVYGTDKVLFCDTVDDYMSNENSEQKSKLFVIIDDIESCSKKMSLALKSKISNTTFRYKELYKNKVTLPDYVDLICTSNARSPKFIDSDNRRDELIVCNTSLQNVTEEMNKFWVQFYAELEDPVLMGKWFHFLSNYDITLNVGSQKCRFDLQVLQKHKLSSMKVVHRFVMKFFSDPECFERSCTHRKDIDNWFDHVRFETPDGVKTCYISKQRSFDYFQSWKKSAGLKLDTKMSTFCEDLAEIGLSRNRKMLGARKLTCFSFAKPYVRKSLKAFYKVDDINLPWNWVDDAEFTEYQKNKFRFRTVHNSGLGGRGQIYMS
jgi:hypothetical protein